MSDLTLIREALENALQRSFGFGPLYSEALAALARIEAERTWRPIDDDTPRDGTEILAWWHESECYDLIEWSYGCWRDTESIARVSDPTHWLPLPPPPESKG